jgi:hypothetical protein
MLWDTVVLDVDEAHGLVVSIYPWSDLQRMAEAEGERIKEQGVFGNRSM